MRIITFLAGLLLAMSLQAKVMLPDLISDNMVLQQNTDVILWGSAAPNKKVKVKSSWDGKTVVAFADENGNWKVSLATPVAGGPYKITFDDGEKLSVENIMIGEVWLCSGQSNMAMLMKGSRSQPVEHSMETIIDARPSQPIRICNVNRAVSLDEKSSCEASWMENTPENVAECSAVAYFFAKRLQQTLNVPVGIIVSARGGSKIESWMSRADLMPFSEHFDFSFLESGVEPKNPHHSPTMLYNAMLAPLTNYVINGVIWYQGCGNISNAELYSSLQPAFVKMLRNLWNNEKLPFYYVQIAPFAYGDRNGIDAALLREAQSKSLKDIPYSGMVVTMDCGDEYCIHPAKKKPVGDRLAYLALEKSYGMKGFEASAPSYESYEIKGNKIYVKFTGSKLGVGPKGQPLDGFEIAGEDQIFYPAEAVVKKEHDQVLVWSDKVSSPVAVRYAFRNCAPMSLYNTYGVPVSPFRTDDWDK